jgi:hypothetical protein
MASQLSPTGSVPYEMRGQSLQARKISPADLALKEKEVIIELVANLPFTLLTYAYNLNADELTDVVYKKRAVRHRAGSSVESHDQL